MMMVFLLYVMQQPIADQDPTKIWAERRDCRQLRRGHYGKED